MGEPKRLMTACTECRQRKIKCSTQSPCSFCAERGLQCVFRPLTSKEREVENAHRKAHMQHTMARNRVSSSTTASPYLEHQLLRAERSVSSPTQQNEEGMKGKIVAQDSLSGLEPCDESGIHSEFSPSGLVSSSPLPVVTIICTLDLRCLRVSNECEWLLGRDAAAIEGLRLDTLVHSAERNYLGSLLDRLVTERPGIKSHSSSQWEPHPLVLEYTPASLLARPMPASTFPKKTMRLHTTMGLFDFFDVRLHLASPFREDRPLIVASLLKYGQDVDHPAISSLDAPPGARLEEDPRWFSSRCFYHRS